ncbi:hypothetical protein ABEB36_010706 [Hypothenemus hampei]|uniref:HTH OST-type domain-containing protein n=1 Tax=Hypothenemus hampei TaxID=57062 RepID=A0ABD1EFK4_HYPHA
MFGVLRRVVTSMMFVLYGERTIRQGEDVPWNSISLTPGNVSINISLYAFKEFVELAREEELEGVKRLVRSVVDSIPRPLSVAQLQRDYRSLIGEDLPFMEFGYLTATSFLCALRDTCFVVQTRVGSDARGMEDPDEAILVHPLITDRTIYLRLLVLANR